MDLFRQRTLSALLFLVLCFFAVDDQTSRPAEARPLPFVLPHQSYSKSSTVESLGLVCKCCDAVLLGAETEKESCKTSWLGSCSKIVCLPWKLQ